VPGCTTSKSAPLVLASDSGFCASCGENGGGEPDSVCCAQSHGRPRGGRTLKHVARDTLANFRVAGTRVVCFASVVSEAGATSNPHRTMSGDPRGLGRGRMERALLSARCPIHCSNTETVMIAARLLLATLTLSATASAQGGVLHYCTPGAAGARLSASGSASFTAQSGMGDFVLRATNVPTGATGVFLMGSGITPAIPFGQGFRCVAGPIFRLGAVTSVAGQASLALDYTDAGSAASMITPGSAWTYQFWFRSGPSFDLTDAIQVVFGPPEPLLGASTIESGVYSSHPLGWTNEGGFEIARDAAQWAALWDLHDGAIPRTPLPTVNFSQEMVVAVFAGRRSTGGHQFVIRGLDLSVAALDVSTLENAPGAGCNVLFVITQPYHFVRVPRVEHLVVRDWRRNVNAASCP